MRYTLARPILDNRLALEKKFPGAAYIGDAGDKAHQLGSGDHTAWSSDVIFGEKMHAGIVYAQDIGGGGALVIPDFFRWLLGGLRAGHYPEVKYVISRHALNKGRDGGRFYGLFDRRYSWRTQKSTGHASYVHISYMPGFEGRDSAILADYWNELHGIKVPPRVKDPQFHSWASAPPLPATSLGRYSTRTLDRLPYSAYPPMVPGYGGPEAPQAQRDFVWALMAYAIRRCKTVMISERELERQEFGPGFIDWARMVVTTKGGNSWVNDPARNGRALGATIGAPSRW